MNMEQTLRRYQKAMQTIGSTINQIIRDTTEIDIKRELFITLQFIASKGQTTNTEIARNFEVGKSTVTAQINRLADQGLVEKSGSTKDKRTIYIAPTQAGIELVRSIERKIMNIVQEKLTPADPHKVENFVGQLEALAELLEK